ncbi:holo-ACP synthase [Chitinimonas sp. BJB300]|uniref:holo-ACP synthase n=1 Tax=Chitinimonas sp. BJB300 TaxID=1559339 RepID=UPI000C0F7655|nr:holo-ACP synthase [Chitinimonas sp. BJB300]PHV11570.1 holo-ACP synthase [Chitinimonas sp. BJB300]TSJ88972.1 holo-ACP synthase [Chitinimonas sp. BJB300]
MIFGIGTDLVEVVRIEQAYQRHGERFLARVLGPDERSTFVADSNSGRFLAKRWAAKEAFAKALGTGIRPPITLAGIQIAHNGMGKPNLYFDPAISAYLAQRAISRTHLSLSDEREHVLAFVVLEITV